jgi:hypothetical protein
MANPKVADRVKDTTTVTGTGTATLANSAPTGYQTFGSAFSTGDVVFYCIQEQSGSGWEVGIGTYTSSGTTLSRTTILASSNAGAAVNFGAGTKDVFCTMPASDLHVLTTKGDLAASTGSRTERVPVGTNGQRLTADSTDAQGLSWKNPSGDMNYFRNIGSTLDRWYLAGLPPTVNTISTASTAQNSANVLRAMPFVCPKDITLDRIAIQVTGTAAGSTRLGIYRSTSATNLYPDALVLDAGTVSVASTGLKSITINQALDAGTLYWFVYVSDAAPGTRGFANSINIFGADNALGTGLGSALSVAFTYGTLPSTFPGSATILSATTMAAIGVRLSA